MLKRKIDRYLEDWKASVDKKLMHGKATCSLGDIIGTIVTSGFTEGLLESAQTTPIIQNTNIGYIKEINV